MQSHPEKQVGGLAYPSSNPRPGDTPAKLHALFESTAAAWFPYSPAEREGFPGAEQEAVHPVYHDAQVLNLIQLEGEIHALVAAYKHAPVLLDPVWQNGIRGRSGIPSAIEPPFKPAAAPVHPYRRVIERRVVG